MTRIVGIDLGTTNSLVAVTKPGGAPSVIFDAEGFNLTPSVVFFKGQQTLVGGQAKRAAKQSPGDYVQFVKRQMGDPHWRFVDTLDREYRPEEISALILRRLAMDASATLGEPVTDAVITVPAYFDDARRKATRDAGEIAGLTVHRLINEPTAAAIAFGLDKLATGTIFVFDLGGGTFDVTVMRASHKDFDVIATDGDRNLGGFDFDNALMRHVAQRIEAEGGPDIMDDPESEFALREQCEQAKHLLSTSEEASIYVTCAGRPYTIDVTRREFEELTRSLLDRTEALAEGVLEDAHLHWSNVDHLLLVGGSTRMPMVRAMIERISGRKPAVGVNPDEAVALGCAIVASTIAGTKVGGVPARISFNDVTSKSMGVVALDGDRNNLRYNSIIVARNHRVPAREERVYYTIEHHQRKVLIEVTEGDEDDLIHTSILAEHLVPLPPGLPAHSPLKVIMSYSIDQMIHIEVIELTSGKSLGEIELQHPNLLRREEVAALRASVAQRDLR